MNDALSEAIKEAFVIAPTNVVVLNTIELRQTGVQAPIYLVQGRQAVTAKDENGVSRNFEPAGFQFTLPPSTEDGIQSVNIAIDNVDRRVTDFIKAAISTQVAVELVYRPYLNTDLTVPQMMPPLVLYLKDLKVILMQVTGRATFMDITNKKFPSILYTREAFPTLG